MPGVGTDAVLAGQNNVDRIKSVITSPAFLFYMYFFGWGALKKYIWPPEPKIIGPMWPSPVEPWSIWGLKLAGWGVFMLVLLLLYIYFTQESLLYVPKQPIQFVEKNPMRYRKPTERDMEY